MSGMSQVRGMRIEFYVPRTDAWRCGLWGRFAVKQSRIGETHPQIASEAAANPQGEAAWPGDEEAANGCFSAFTGGGNLANISLTLAY
jgi:hypothetical protein